MVAMLRLSTFSGQRCASSFIGWATTASTKRCNQSSVVQWELRRRHFSNGHFADPVIDIAAFQNSLTKQAPAIHDSLITNGFYTTQDSYSILPKNIIEIMRHQSIKLRQKGRFEQSWSEKIDAVSGNVTRFDKEGVFACEPDGGDYEMAPDLITYMAILLQTLPDLLNSTDEEIGLSSSSFNAKLAVTSPGGSAYPLHIDNPQGLTVNDTRKLTCIIYLNPKYCDGDGGELRIYHDSDPNSNSDGKVGKSDNYSDLKPDGGRMVLFWSDVIPHEVLPTAPDADVNDDTKDRYALTIWIPTSNYHTIHDPRSRFAKLGDETF